MSSSVFIRRAREPISRLTVLRVPIASRWAIQASGTVVDSGCVGCVRQVQQKGWVKAGRGQVVYGSGLVDLSRFGGNI